MKKALTLIVLVMLLVLTLSSVVAQDDTCFAELDVMITSNGVEFVRTPDACFENLLDWDYETQYVEIDGLRQAYVDVGSGESGETILLLHGQPSWSYLYRKMIPVLVEEGHRVIAMDHLGLGRSDKPIDPDYYSYVGHVERLETFIEDLELEGITPFVQDWGSLIGLQVIGTNPEWFDRLLVGNGFLPTFPAGETVSEPPANPRITRNLYHTNVINAPAQQVTLVREETNQVDIDTSLIDESFGIWTDYALNDERFRPEVFIESYTYFDLSSEEEAGYAAPFPSRTTMGGARAFPGLFNELGGVTDSGWAGLGEFDKPFLTIWGDNDSGNIGHPSIQQMLIDHIPGSDGWDHTRLEEAGHYLQDDQGEEIARRMNEFIAKSSGNDDMVTSNDTSNVCENPSSAAAIMEAMVNNAGDDDGPSFGETNTEQLMRMLQAPTEGPFYMVNLIKYHELAVYPDGRETDQTGREANALYSPTEFLTAIGARPVFIGDVTSGVTGEESTWDSVAIVQYPCPLALFSMNAIPEFQERAVYKDAGLEESTIMVTHIRSLDEFELPNVAPDETAFELMQVVRYNDEAQYADGSDEPMRTGQEAMDLYADLILEAGLVYGVYPKARLEVQGVYIGDGQDWSEAWVYYAPSQEAFDAFLADPIVIEAQYHRDAALDDAYELIVDPTFSMIPN